MPSTDLFPGEDERTRHPDDARHWAEVYASLLRTLPRQLNSPLIQAHLLARLEYWEERLREVDAEASALISTYNRDRPPRVRRESRGPGESVSRDIKPAELTR